LKKFDEYAYYYDLLYEDKDYQAEASYIDQLIKNYNPRARTILDLGCGTGTNVITLAQRGWQVVGVDFVKRAIQSARRKADQTGVSAEFVVSDVTRLEKVDGDFDLVLDIGCFHSLDTRERESYLQNLERLTKPGSTFLVYCSIYSG